MNFTVKIFGGKTAESDGKSLGLPLRLFNYSVRVRGKLTDPSGREQPRFIELIRAITILKFELIRERCELMYKNDAYITMKLFYSRQNRNNANVEAIH